MTRIGAPELIIVLVIIVLLFGPGRISKMAGELGQGIRAFREGVADPKEENAEAKSETSDTVNTTEQTETNETQEKK